MAVIRENLDKIYNLEGQTLREFIRETEKLNDISPVDLNTLSDYHLEEYVEMLERLK